MKTICFSVLLNLAVLQASAAEQQWFTDFSEAQAKAQSENKMVLVYFTGSNWASNCMAFKREVLSTPDFAEYAEKELVLLEVDFPRNSRLSEAQKAANKELKDRFRQQGFPTIILLNAKNEELGRQVGYTPGRGGILAKLKEWVANRNRPYVLPANLTVPKTNAVTRNRDSEAESPASPGLVSGGELKPAVLKDNDPSRISGEYADADLQAVLVLFGRLQNSDPTISEIVFFKGFAAQVHMNGHYYNCAANASRQWNVVEVSTAPAGARSGGSNSSGLMGGRSHVLFVVLGAGGLLVLFLIFKRK